MQVELSVREMELITKAIQGDDEATPEVSAEYLKIMARFKNRQEVEEAAKRGAN